MAATHHEGPLFIGGKQVTGNTAIAELEQTISATPTQEEVQAISDKVDAIIATLVAAGIIKEA